MYLIGDQRLEAGSPEFAEAIAAAHSAHQRPRCLCLAGGIEMYVSRLPGVHARNGESFIVKRMPDTGSRHAPDCPSYEPPSQISGLGQVLGSAIIEDPASGGTTLKLDFAMSRVARGSTAPASATESASVGSKGAGLSLRGLLHYLWDQAELTRWHPGFSGKRSWATVRSHLLQAAMGKTARGASLRSRLYVPEVFAVEHRESIDARRAAQWSSASAEPGKPLQLMLLIGELKEIMPARYGFRAVVKHVPDHPFALDEQLFRRIERRFQAELTLWGATEDTHMVVIATFSVAAGGVPSIAELSLMPVTRHWLPVESTFERQLVERLVDDGRRFIKGLRYDLGTASVPAFASLTDCGSSAPVLFVVPGGVEDFRPLDQVREASTPVWVWRPLEQAMPLLPRAASLPASSGGGRSINGEPCP